MEKVLLEGKLGVVGEYKAEITGGSVRVGVGLSIGSLLDGLAKLIPGTIDDAVIGIVKGALGVVSAPKA